jgi:hypothetical protein
MKTLIWILPFLILACSSTPSKITHIEEDSLFEEELDAAPGPRAPAKSSEKSSSTSHLADHGKDCRSPVGFIAHGQSMSFYQHRRVPEGFPCEKEVRVCNDGELSGSFAYSSCIAVP